jgi:hypothetical protein
VIDAEPHFLDVPFAINIKAGRCCLYDIVLQFPTNIAASLKSRLDICEFDLIDRYLIQIL